MRFAQNATAGDDDSGADLTIGEALTVAKQEYKGSLAIVGAYDEKAMAELTFYGLPMYRIGGSSAASMTGCRDRSSRRSVGGGSFDGSAAQPDRGRRPRHRSGDRASRPSR